MTKDTLSTTQYYHPVPEPFKPNDKQREREAALKRFNRLYVLLPIVAISVISVLLIVFMIVGVLIMSIRGNVNKEFLSFISGLADITIIMFLIPMIILMISGPMMLWSMIKRSRTRRKMGKPAFDQGGSLQVLLWKMDNLIVKSQNKTNEVAPQLANRVIRFNESIAYVVTFLKQITSYFKRS